MGDIPMEGDFMTIETFKIKSGYVSREIAGEFLAIPVDPELDSSNIVILNPATGFLRENLLTECTLPQLVKAVTENFTVDEATAESDIKEFLQMLKESNMLE